MSDTVAQDQIRAFVDRILRLKEEAKSIEADIRDEYAAAAEAGIDKTDLGLRVRMAEQSRRNLEVYFAAFPAAKLLKIGISGNVPKRLQTLSSVVGERAQLLLTFPGVFALEGWYHAEFNPWRRRGEWFDLCDASVARVERLRAEGPAINVRAA